MSEIDGQPAVLGSNLTLEERLTAVEARVRAFQSLEGNFDLLYDDVDRLLDHRATVETILTRHGLNRRAQPQVNAAQPAPTQNGANGVTINGAVHAAAPPAQNQRGIRPYHSTVAVMDNLVARLNELTTRVNEVTTRVNQFTQLEATIHQLSARADQIVAFFDRKTAQIDALSARVDRLSTQVHQLSIRVDEISTQVNDNSARTADILAKQDALTQQLADLTALFTAFHAEHEALASR
ncbi:MAG: hypothetical protein Q9188_005803, partial [Gyalolechia gomerana]